MLLGDLLEFAAARYPERIAIIDGQRRYTYAAWNARVNAVAHALRACGVGPGDHVVQVTRNREEHCAVAWACYKLGAINTPINFRWTSGEIAFCANDADARLVVFEPSTSDQVQAAQLASAARLLCLGQPFDDVVAQMPSNTPPSASVKADDTALMLYTSGTTGRPKGVPRSQANEYAATIGQIVQHQYAPGERTLGVMPLYHTMGVHSLSAMLALNGVFVCMPEWDAPTALRLVQDEGLTCLYLVPTLFHMLVHEPAFDAYDVSSVSKLSYAGAPMLSSLVEACVERFRPEVFVNHYGSTEVYTFSICEDAQRKPGCAGRAAFHAAVRVVRAEAEPTVGPDDVVGPGETGEVIVSLASPEAFAGYFNRPEPTARAIRQGWYFTGDTGHFDAEGDLWVTGRVDDMIITGGENVQPVEVEEVLARAPGVREVAVVGLPDERWGQIVAAFIVPTSGEASVAQIESVAAGQLARYKRPRKLVLVKQIPKSPVGKVLRRLLVAGEYEAL